LMTAVEVARTRGLAGAEADALAQQARGLYETVRTVSQGIRPAVLEDHGLLAAAETLARQCPLPTTVGGTGRRWPGEVEGALYFVVAEALTNVVKHADASTARVVVSEDGVEVRDDGHGLVDPSQGTGLRGLADRLEAVGCVLELRREQEWTVIAARVT
jgi:signal transduction histidine kinase